MALVEISGKINEDNVEEEDEDENMALYILMLMLDRPRLCGFFNPATMFSLMKVNRSLYTNIINSKHVFSHLLSNLIFKLEGKNIWKAERTYTLDHIKSTVLDTIIDATISHLDITRIGICKRLLLEERRGSMDGDSGKVLIHLMALVQRDVLSGMSNEDIPIADYFDQIITAKQPSLDLKDLYHRLGVNRPVVSQQRPFGQSANRHYINFNIHGFFRHNLSSIGTCRKQLKSKDKLNIRGNEENLDLFFTTGDHSTGNDKFMDGFDLEEFLSKVIEIKSSGGAYGLWNRANLRCLTASMLRDRNENRCKVKKTRSHDCVLKDSFEQTLISLLIYGNTLNSLDKGQKCVLATLLLYSGFLPSYVTYYKSDLRYAYTKNKQSVTAFLKAINDLNSISALMLSDDNDLMYDYCGRQLCHGSTNDKKKKEKYLGVVRKLKKGYPSLSIPTNVKSAIRKLSYTRTITVFTKARRCKYISLLPKDEYVSMPINGERVSVPGIRIYKNVIQVRTYRKKHYDFGKRFEKIYKWEVGALIDPDGNVLPMEPFMEHEQALSKLLNYFNRNLTKFCLALFKRNKRCICPDKHVIDTLGQTEDEFHESIKQCIIDHCEPVIKSDLKRKRGESSSSRHKSSKKRKRMIVEDDLDEDYIITNNNNIKRRKTN